jgi:hypothetical protein
MNKKNRRKDNSILDLHELNFFPKETPKEAVNRELDRFFTKWLMVKSVNLTIIVGKGLGSKKLINGKNPLRFYTEEYLNLLQIEWRNEKDWFGQEGVIKVRW